MLSQIRQSKMGIYLAGLVVLIIVYTLFMACWLESYPPIPGRSISGRDPQQRAGYKEQVAGERDNQSQGGPTMRRQVGSDVNRGDGQKQGDKHDDSSASCWWPSPEFITAICAFIALFIYFWQVVVGWWQWDATNKQWEVMVLDQRPWIASNEPQLAPLALLADLTAYCEVKNSGKTPAHVISSAFDLFYAFRPERGDINSEIDKEVSALLKNFHGQSLEASIAPGDGQAFEKAIMQMMQEFHIESINKGGMVPVLVGRIEYTGLSETVHVTQFCYIYDHSIRRFRKYHKYNNMK
jgi:hypothetical protein